MGCCSSSPQSEPEAAKSVSTGQTADAVAPPSVEVVDRQNTQQSLQVPGADANQPDTEADRQRTESQEDAERHARQMSYLDKVYREKRIQKQQNEQARISKLNSDRSERLEKQWSDREKTEHFTAKELFYKLCKEYPYDAYKYEQYIRSFFEEEDDFGVGNEDDEDDDELDLDEELWMPKHVDKTEVIDRPAFFKALGELLLPISTKEELHKNLDKSKMREEDVKMMEEEIDKQHTIIWKFFIYDPDEQVKVQRECDIQTYMTFDDFSSGLSGLISSTVDYTSKAHKLISDTLFQIMDHDRDGYLDTHDITALLLALHKMYAAVFNYQTPEVLSRDDVEERAIALLGKDWGMSKVDQPVQFLNKRQFAHLFGELGEKHLKDLDLESILVDDPNSPRSPRR